MLYNFPPSVKPGNRRARLQRLLQRLRLGAQPGPAGRPTPAEVSDQYVASALIPVPADYAANWASYHLQVSIGNQSITLAAPAPSA